MDNFKSLKDLGKRLPDEPSIKQRGKYEIKVGFEWWIFEIGVRKIEVVKTYQTFIGKWVGCGEKKEVSTLYKPYLCHHASDARHRMIRAYATSRNSESKTMVMEEQTKISARLRNIPVEKYMRSFPGY
jgi:hypothetical protein